MKLIGRFQQQGDAGERFGKSCVKKSQEIHFERGHFLMASARVTLRVRWPKKKKKKKERKNRGKGKDAEKRGKRGERG